MKNVKRTLLVIFSLTLLIGFYQTTNVGAAKRKVTYTLKSGTLTVKGKGNMPKKMIFEDNSKIKKVVIKKGVTSISDNAFARCKNLKSVSIASSVKKIGKYAFYSTPIETITIPKSVKSIGQCALKGCDSLKTITMPGDFTFTKYSGDEGTDEINGTYSLTGKSTNVETITFTTPIKVKNITYLYTNNFVLSSKDKKYKSINGVIYTKDGTNIVRVPSERKELVVEEGCTTFNIQSVIYGGNQYNEDMCGGCQKLTKITFPASLKNIDSTKYMTQTGMLYTLKEMTLVNNSKQINGISISNLSNMFSESLIENYYDVQLGPDDKTYKDVYEMLMNVFPEQIVKKEDSYITKDNVYLLYTGNSASVTLDLGITAIGDKAFSFNRSVKEVKLPQQLEYIGKEAFRGAGNITGIALPETLATIGNEAFSGTNIASFVIPKNVKRIGYNALNSSKKATITFNGTVTDLDSEFAKATSISTLNFNDGIKVARTVVKAPKTKKKGKNCTITVSYASVSGASGYQVKYAYNKSFKKAKSYTAGKKTTCKIKAKYNKGKNLYVKVRPYKKVKGKKVYGKWSNVQYKHLY